MSSLTRHSSTRDGLDTANAAGGALDDCHQERGVSHSMLALGNTTVNQSNSDQSPHSFHDATKCTADCSAC